MFLKQLEGSDSNDADRHFQVLIKVVEGGWSGNPLFTSNYASTRELANRIDDMLKSMSDESRRLLIELLVAHAVLDSRLLWSRIAVGVELPWALKAALESELHVPLTTLRVARLRGSNQPDEFRRRLVSLLEKERVILPPSTATSNL